MSLVSVVVTRNATSYTSLTPLTSLTSPTSARPRKCTSFAHGHRAEGAGDGAAGGGEVPGRYSSDDLDRIDRERRRRERETDRQEQEHRWPEQDEPGFDDTYGEDEEASDEHVRVTRGWHLRHCILDREDPDFSRTLGTD